MLGLALALLGTPVALEGEVHTSTTSAIELRPLGSRPDPATLRLPRRRTEPGLVWGLGSAAVVGFDGDVHPQGTLRFMVRPWYSWGLTVLLGARLLERESSLRLDTLSLGSVSLWPLWLELGGEGCARLAPFELCGEVLGGAEAVLARSEGTLIFDGETTQVRLGPRFELRGRVRWLGSDRLQPWLGIAGAVRPGSPDFGIEGVGTSAVLPIWTAAAEVGVDVWLSGTIGDGD